MPLIGLDSDETIKSYPLKSKHRFAIGISGYLISTADGKPISVFGWFDVPATLADAGAQADFAGALHFWLAWSVVVLSVMHGFMALKHHFIDKDDTLKRMLGKSSSDYGV